MVVGGGHKLASWALLEFMPTSKCAYSLDLLYPILRIYSHRRAATKKNARMAAAMNMIQLLTLALVAQSQNIMTRKDVQ
jgi:hypothetical protein